MVQIQKPILSENMKVMCNRVYTYLKTYPGYHAKEEIAQWLGLDAKKMDRQIRDVISNLAKVKPIISTSDSRGYKLAQTDEDMEEVKHQIMELRKRADEILIRTAPLINFMEG